MMLLNQAGQRGTAWKPATPPFQGRIDCSPSFAGNLQHGTRPDVGPSACALEVFFGPAQYLLQCQQRQVLFVPYTTMLGEQFGQGRSSRQCSDPFVQGLIDRIPVFTWRK